MDYLVNPADSIKGEIKVPGDKSITHRAIMLASIASGQSRLSGVLEGEDCLATKKVFELMGVNFIKEDDNLIVEGVGIKGLRQPERELDFGNSGTGIRLSSGILVAQKFDTELIGDSSLSERPMSRIVEPLSLMGANISSNQGVLPINIKPTTSLRGITFSLPVASAQVKSALLLAGLYAEGYTEVKEDKITRNHTETIFNEFGIPVEVNKGKNSRSIRVSKSDKINPKNLIIPSDFSSASFFILAALITPKSHLRITGVGINETRIGFLHALRHMGGKIDIQNIQNGPEPIADLLIESSKLKGITLNTKLVANMIDEMPAFFIAASLAEGTTIVKDAEELRTKESDRLEAMANVLEALGVKFKLNQDGMVIHGLGDKGIFKAVEINSLGDHRIAMASSIASLRAEGEVRIVDCDNVRTSFPDFVSVCSHIGIKIKEQ